VTAGGDLLVGTTSSATNRRFEVQSTGDGSGQLGLRNSGATAGLYWTMGPNASNNIVVYNQSSVGVFISDGNTSWSSSSDERLKTDLKNIENAFDKVATLRAVTETGEPEENEQLNCMKVSDVEGDPNVAGVFVNWDKP
jgi:hypothetical protein